MDLLFFYTANYREAGRTAASFTKPDSLEVWTPSLWRILPPGLPLYPFAVWWLFHQFRVFRNRQYMVIFIRDGKRVIHRTTVVPCYFRFPFMASNDVQVGVWTDPKHRGCGLAVMALQKAVELTRESSRRMWYIVRETNLPSIRVAEKWGLALAGRGRRIPRFGIKVFGKFLLEIPAVADEPSASNGTNHQDPLHLES